MKDCTTCKYGFVDEQLGIPMCHHPLRFFKDCVDFNMHEEKEFEYAPDTSNTDTSATISSVLNEFGRKVAGKCYGMSPVSDSCEIVVNKVNTEEYINRIVDAVKKQMMKDAVEGKKLSDGLEEAAEEYNKQVIEATKCHHNALTYAEGYEDALLLIPDAFIAGAKWMSIHGNKIKEL